MMTLRVRRNVSAGPIDSSLGIIVDLQPKDPHDDEDENEEDEEDDREEEEPSVIREPERVAVSPKTGPCGSWKSPITSDLIAAQSISLSEPRLDGEQVYWLEGRPQELGRYVALKRLYPMSALPPKRRGDNLSSISDRQDRQFSCSVRGMHEYRLCVYDAEDRQIAPPLVISADNDEAATEQAKKMLEKILDGVRAELRDGDRLVIRLPKE